MELITSAGYLCLVFYLVTQLAFFRVNSHTLNQIYSNNVVKPIITDFLATWGQQKQFVNTTQV